MKRRLLIIAVFLLLGAVVNVAVAWGCAWWPRSAIWIGDDEDLHVLPSSRDVGWWNKHVFPLFDADIDVLWESPDLGVEIRWFSGTDSNQRSVSAGHVLSGWPTRSMSGETWDAVVPGQRPKWSNRRAMFVGRGFIPLRPLWPGFAINTLFYATLLWLLIPGPFALRRFLRVRRGLCPKCAYPMGESGVCTECGKPLPSST